MENKALNDQVFQVFIIIAETLDKWENPTTEKGMLVLKEHYQWGLELKNANKLLLAGPTDFELTSSGKINPIGHPTGLIILNVSNREEAMAWSMRDPFHIHGFRRNRVHSLNITMTQQMIWEALNKISHS